MKKTRYKIGQFVRIKDAKLRDRYPESTGLILGFVGWLRTNKGYGILMEDGSMTDFREEEIEPIDNIDELQDYVARAANAIITHRLSIVREVLTYGVNLYNYEIRIKHDAYRQHQL